MSRIQSLKQIANLKNFSKFFNYQTVTDHVVDSLLKEGQRIIREAYESKNWNNRTYNLYNSYVAAVIANGKVVKSIYLGPEKNPSGEDEEYTGYKRWHTSVERPLGANDAQRGREEADLFVESYAKQHKSKKITLVVGAAMFYAGILESNGYHVLANVSTNLENWITLGPEGQNSHSNCCAYSEELDIFVKNYNITFSKRKSGDPVSGIPAGYKANFDQESKGNYLPQ
jgi:hypothetical protein